MMRLTIIAIALACCVTAAAQAESGLYICAEHADPGEWDAAFQEGPIVIPAGTVFDYAGHLMGENLQDPMDRAHWHAGRWTGLSREEEERRSQLAVEDSSIDERPTSGVVTTAEVRISKSKPCALAPAKALLSERWGWTISPIVGDLSLYYQAYGIIRRGALDTNFSDEAAPVNFLAARGELNASVRDTIVETLRLDEWSASQPPDNAPVQGKGNSECWGDDSRQDISCRALTEAFLWSMRVATKAEVIKAMNVKGREIPNGLQFVSNYSRGERWGSGYVNFLFGGDGRVSIIYASLDRPDMNGKFADFIWNSTLLPEGCSDLPGSNMDRCGDPKTIQQVEARKRLISR